MKPVVSSLYEFDVTLCSILDENNNTLLFNKCSCYSDVANTEFNTVLADPKAKTIQFVYPNTLLNHESGLKIYNTFFMSFIKRVGLFRKGTIRHGTFKDVDKRYLKFFPNLTKQSHILILEYDISSDITMQEMFFYGVIIRTVSCFPRVIATFRRLKRRFPHEDEFRLFLLSFKLKVLKEEVIESRGHVFLSAVIPHLVPDSNYLERVYTEIDKGGYKAIKDYANNTGFWGGHNVRMGLENLLFGDVVKSPNHVGWGGMVAKGYQLKITQEVLDLYKDHDKFIKVFGNFTSVNLKNFTGISFH